MTVEVRVLGVAVVGSGIVFLDGTIVNVALPSIRDDLGADLRGLQWILDAYLVTLTALLLFGGALGDRFGRRRVFLVGVAGFAAASLLCGAAPSTGFLIGARALQGVAGALLVPGSLALLSATVPAAQRARWIGAWSGLTGAASAVGPFAGGWLVDAASWRWAFLVNLPLAAVVVVLARGVPESVAAGAPTHLDVVGAVTAAVGLAALASGLIEAGDGWSATTGGPVVAGGDVQLDDLEGRLRPLRLEERWPGPAVVLETPHHFVPTQQRARPGRCRHFVWEEAAGEYASLLVECRVKAMRQRLAEADRDAG